MLDRASKMQGSTADEQAHVKMVNQRLDQTAVGAQSSTQELDEALNKDKPLLIAVIKERIGILRLEKWIDWGNERRASRNSSRHLHSRPGSFSIVGSGL